MGIQASSEAQRRRHPVNRIDVCGRRGFQSVPWEFERVRRQFGRLRRELESLSQPMAWLESMTQTIRFYQLALHFCSPINSASPKATFSGS